MKRYGGKMGDLPYNGYTYLFVEFLGTGVVRPRKQDYLDLVPMPYNFEYVAVLNSIFGIVFNQLL